MTLAFHHRLVRPSDDLSQVQLAEELLTRGVPFDESIPRKAGDDLGDDDEEDDQQ